VRSKAKSNIAAKISDAISDTETVSWVARIGYVTRGAIFLIIGGLALLAAGGSAERPQGVRDALQTVFAQPFGGFALWAVAAGLGCFAGWRFLQSVLDADALGNGPYGLMRRASFAGPARSTSRSPRRRRAAPSRRGRRPRTKPRAVGRIG